MTETKFDVTKVSIEGISIVDEIVTNPPGYSENDLDKYEFRVDYHFLSEASVSSRALRMTFDCSIILLDAKSREPLGPTAKFLIYYYFAVDNYEELVFEKEEDIIVDPYLGVCMANIAYSTSRGIIFAKTQGSVYENGFLPLLPNKDIFALMKPDDRPEKTHEL